MKVVTAEQRTPEWYEERMGIPTASSFDKIITSKGEISASRTKYLYKLVAEKLSGTVETSYINDAMQHGIDTEAEARKVYELVTLNDVEQVGFCLSDCERYGASPDGLVGEDGLLEIKCPKAETHIEYLLNGKLPTAYFQQVQGQLLVTGRKWCDFMSYVLNLKPFIIRVGRDEEFIKKLEQALIEFDKEKQEIIKQIS
jgi:putative phage-type endonuclease